PSFLLTAPATTAIYTLSLHDALPILARFPEHGATAESLLQKADVAMYVAKSDKSGLAVYAPDRDRHTDRRLSIITELRTGLDTGDRKSTRLNSSHVSISYAVFCLKKK